MTSHYWTKKEKKEKVAHGSWLNRQHLFAIQDASKVATSLNILVDTDIVLRSNRYERSIELFMKKAVPLFEEIDLSINYTVPYVS